MKILNFKRMKTDTISIMEVNLMTIEEILKMFGNREVEALDKNGDVIDTSILIQIKDHKGKILWKI